jgi:hypothetical protein
MKKTFIFITMFFMAITVFAQRTNITAKSPMSGWEFTEWSVTLNGRRFGKLDLPQSWREQNGYALVQGRRLYYWLYDTVSYHRGKADEIYNEFLPSWVEKLGYVIDYDNISISDPNPSLASSVKTLMQQRGCDVSVTIISGPIGNTPAYDIDFLIVNEWFKSRGVYKTTQYPLILFYEGW